MKQFYINRTLVIFLFTFMTILLLISSLCICYAIEDKIDESKLDGYYLDPEEFETPNNFINGYGIIQNSYGYSRSIKYGLIDKNYNVVLNPDTYFQIDFDPVNKNIIYGYIDPWTRLGDIYKITDNGLVKITKEMYYLNMNDVTEHSFFYGSNIISVQNKDLYYGVIDINGNIVMDFTKNYFYKAFSPIIIKYEILNDDYDLKNPPILKNAQIINEKGNILTNFKYDRIDFYLNNNESESEIVYIQVTKDNKINLLNLDNYSEVFDWSAFQVFRKYNNNIIAENSEGKWGVLNKEFQIIKDFIYDDVYIKYNDTYKGEILEGEINNIRERLLPEDKVKTPKNLTATLPTFNITLNGMKIKNNDRLYPFIV